MTGVIKANIPARIAFRVASEQASCLILDEDGAEKLRAGQMLYNSGTGQTVRAQAVLVRDEEIKQTVDFIGTRTTPQFDEELCRKLA